MESAAGDIACVSFLVGPTPVTPREVYHVHFPPREDLQGRDEAAASAPAAKKQASMLLFRSLVKHEILFQRMGRPIMPTNLFVAVRKRRDAASAISPWLLPKPEYANLRRGTVTEILLRSAAGNSDAKKRAQFQTPYQPRRAIYTPVSMELCTPLVPGPRAAPPAAPEDATPLRPLRIDMVETPCVSSRIRRAPSPAGTPLFERPRARRLRVVDDEGEEEPVEGEEEQEGVKEGEEEDPFEWYISARPVRGFRDPRVNRRV